VSQPRFETRTSPIELHGGTAWSTSWWRTILSRAWSDYRRGFGFVIGFIDHFNTSLVIARNYSAVTDCHTLPNHAKCFPDCCVLASSCLGTASNNGYSSASVLKSSLNGCSLSTAYSSKSKSKLCYDRRFRRPVRLERKHPSGA
jgi:hypothetical protein